MPQFNLTYQLFGERSILIEWPSVINTNILYDILIYKLDLQQNFIKEKVYIKHAYSSILVSYADVINDYNNKVLQLKELYASDKDINKSFFKCWKIPVCYDDEFGLDIEDLTIKKNISKSDLIKLHSENIYTIYFVGFLPGFLYLGGLNEQLHFQRRSTPRLKVEKGAVAIGGSQTGIYPSLSPGGWNIIGNTPIDFFNANSESPCFAKAGDTIKFHSVTLKEYSDIKALVDAGAYQIESEVVDD